MMIISFPFFSLNLIDMLPVFGGEVLNVSSVFFVNNNISEIKPAYLTASDFSRPSG